MPPTSAVRATTEPLRPLSDDAVKPRCGRSDPVCRRFRVKVLVPRHSELPGCTLCWGLFCQVTADADSRPKCSSLSGQAVVKLIGIRPTRFPRLGGVARPEGFLDGFPCVAKCAPQRFNSSLLHTVLPIVPVNRLALPAYSRSRETSPARFKRTGSRSPFLAASMMRRAIISRTTSDASLLSAQAASKASPIMRVVSSSNSVRCRINCTIDIAHPDSHSQWCDGTTLGELGQTAVKAIPDF